MLYLGKLGKLPPKEDRLRRTLKLSAYVDLGKIDYPPDDVDWSGWTRQYPMWRNDTIGDCTIAACANKVADWCAAAKAPFTITEKQVVEAYSAICGYVPETGENDFGCYSLDVLNYFRNTGIGGYKLYAYARVNHDNILEMKLANGWFGGLYYGLSMPTAWQKADTWMVPDQGMVGDGAKASWGGHAVSGNRATAGWLFVTTWGQKQRVQWQAAMGASYADEVYALLSPVWADPTHKSPNGFAFQDLVSDLGKITAMNPPE